MNSAENLSGMPLSKMVRAKNVNIVSSSSLFCKYYDLKTD